MSNTVKVGRCMGHNTCFGQTRKDIFCRTDSLTQDGGDENKKEEKVGG